jgi:hypothetical protein
MPLRFGAIYGAVRGSRFEFGIENARLKGQRSIVLHEGYLTIGRTPEEGKTGEVMKRFQNS